MSRGPLALLLAVVALLAGAWPVAAHESAPAGTIRVAQTLADRELTVTLTPPPSGSGRMGVAVEALGAAPARPVDVHGEAVGAVTPVVSVVPGPVGAPGRSAIDLDRAGAWEIVLDDGGAAARIPVRWVDPGTPASLWAYRIGALVAVVAGIATATVVRRRIAVAAGLGALAAAGAAVAITAYVLAPTPVPAAYVAGGTSAGATPATGDAPTMAGHGMAGMAGMGGMQDMPATAPMGEGAVLMTSTLTGSVLDLALRDGSTGAPVDDLAVHDEAFIHLAVLGQDGSEQHLHPVRTGPGAWQVRLAPTPPGRYGVFAEFSRDGMTHQQVRSAVDVPGAPPAPTPLPGPGPRVVGDMDVDVAVTGAVVGRPATVRATFVRGGAPVTDLQSWLGMAGHLFVLGPGTDPADAAVSFAHVHDMQARPPGRGYGPEVTFTYAFPEPGTYRLWLQVLRDGALVTVPVEVPLA
ncbi:hypothetical protein WCD74_09910 [Actinomycetospora sp. OC33-EN08]|uniref:Secreted protein n=1 Tax=Actinomycetospora aurantiaca TaxID=3129233 RepID=A0ABU8MM49_9PSEU